MSARRFREDCIEIAAVELAAGRLSRRSFLRTAALLGAGALPAGGALAAGALAAGRPEQIVHANWGGVAAACTADIYGAAFEKAHGIDVTVDGSGPLESNIAAMVEAGEVVWDACDTDFFNVLRLAGGRQLEAIDYAIVDREGYPAPHAHAYGVLGYWFSYVMAWDTAKIGAAAPSWADFFDVERIPGKRALYKWMSGAPEAALLADGVPPARIYPLDLERALAKIERIKEHVVFWDSGAASQQLFLDGEVVMGNLWHTRAELVRRDTEGRVAWTFDQGLASPAAWLIPKGNPAGAAWANRWLATLQDPELQVEVMRCFGQGPANPRAFDMMTEAERRLTPGAPENLARMVPLDSAYFAAHYGEALDAFTGMISG